MSDSSGYDRFQCLFQVAASQMGYVTTHQARACGMSTSLISYHAGTGRLVRVYPRVYRLRDYPSMPREEVMAAWLAAGSQRAVVSHESALDLHGLDDMIPDAIHLTVPRTVRNLPVLEGVRLHTTTLPFGTDDVIIREGMRVTTATRTILDLAQAGLSPDRVEQSVREALDRGIMVDSQLEKDVAARSKRVQLLIRDILPGAA